MSDPDLDTFYEALAEHAVASEHENDAAIIEAAIEAVPVVPAAPRHSAVRIGGMTVLVAVAAAVLVWLVWPSEVVLRSAEGSWVSEAGDTVAQGDRLPEGVWLRVEGDACIGDGVARLCASPGTRLRVRDTNGHGLDLNEGAVVVVSGTWSVWSGGELVRLEAGDSLDLGRPPPSTSDEVEQAPAPAPELDPPSPEVEPEETTGEAPEVDSKTPQTTRSRPDAATLVGRARKARGEGRLADAERDYAALLRHHPKSAEARAGRVALGQIKLRRGKAKAALRLFSVASKGGGPLAEEAAWGRIQALDELGRKDALKAAVEAFIAKYPTSVYRARARGRLQP